MTDDIAQWLEGLGLGEYAQSFAENGVNFDALPHLSEDDLKDLGLVLGHRRIRKFRTSPLQFDGGWNR